MTTLNTTINWQDVTVLASDAETEIGKYRTESELNRGEIVKALGEYQQSGSISGYFLAPLDGQDAEDVASWGPSREEIDWSGFPA